MSTELHCQSCQTPVPTPEGSAGESVTCPGCGARIFVPTSDSEETIALKVPANLRLDDRPEISGESDVEDDWPWLSEESETPASGDAHDSDDMPRLSVVDSAGLSGDNKPSRGRASDGSNEAAGRLKKRRDSRTVPRLPVIKAPPPSGPPSQKSSSEGDADIAGRTTGSASELLEDSTDIIQLRQSDETDFEPGVSESMIDMMTSHENRVWRENRAIRRAHEEEQKMIFQWGVRSCVVSMLIVIGIGLPFVLSAPTERRESLEPATESPDDSAASS